MTVLYAARFENNDTNAAQLENLPDIEAGGIRWNLERFGVDTIEVTVKARNRDDMHIRLNNHQGQRLAVFDPFWFRPISGNIVDVQEAGARRVKYVCRGPAWRHDDLLVRTTFPTGQDTDERLKSLLSTYVDVVSSDVGDIDATGKDAAEFQTEWPRGNYPSEIINAYRNMSDGSQNSWDYWCVDEPFDGTALKQYKPYFRARSSRALRWVVQRSDLSSLQLNRSISELKSYVRVWYGSFEGTVTTANAAGTTLIDAVANFTGFGVEPGDRITNITDGSRGKVKTVNSGGNITLVGDGLVGGSDAQFDLNDEYTIERLDAWYSAASTAADAPLTRHYEINDSRMRYEQAQSYADILTDFYGSAIQQQRFTVASRYIRSVNGARWPLHQVIAQGGGIIQISDLYPTVGLNFDGLDSQTTFLITAMDYDLTRNTLTVYPDSIDGRLDARLRAVGILGREMVGRT